MSAPYFIYGIVLFGLGMLAGVFITRQRRKEEVNTSWDNTIPDSDLPDHSGTSENEYYPGVAPSEIFNPASGHEKHPGSKTLPDEVSGKGAPSESKKEDILLIVEDNVDMNNFISEQFENDYDILRAYNGEEGTRLAIEHIPDLVISDLMMPVRDGLELCNILKNDEITSHIPIILLTAKATVENRILGLETGADDYIAKPYNPNELIVRARNLIEQRKKLQEKFGHAFLLGPQKINVQSADETFLRKLMTFIEDNLSSENLGVEFLSDKLGYSRSQLYRKIKALTGNPVNKLIRDFRLTRAEEMIKQKYGSVSEIAFEVGFNNLSYFSRSFREKFGKLPSEY